MRLILTLIFLAIPMSAAAQVVGNPQRVISDKDVPKKNLVLVRPAGIVERVIVIREDWTENEWAPFVPEGYTAFVEDPALPAMPKDRYIDGKIMRFAKQPNGVGGERWALIDPANPDPEPAMVPRIWPNTASAKWGGQSGRIARLEEELEALKTGEPLPDYSNVVDQQRANAKSIVDARGGNPINWQKVKQRRAQGVQGGRP